MHATKETVHTVAARFVGVVRMIDWWKMWAGTEALLPGEVLVLFEAVSVAGFNPKEVVPGKLIGDLLDQSGGRTGETYKVNSLCPYKVVAEDGEDDYAATSWLDSRVQWVVANPKHHTDIVEMVARQIEESVPLEMVRLTSEGDFLREYPSTCKHERDEDALRSTIGVHNLCNGFVDLVGTSQTHAAIVCRNCCLRIVVPKGIRTYGDLRREMARRLGPPV